MWAAIGGFIALVVAVFGWWVKTQPDRERKRRDALYVRKERLKDDIAEAAATGNMVRVMELERELDRLRKTR